MDFSYFPYPVADKSQLCIAVVEEIYPDCQYWQIIKELRALDVDEEVLYRPFETLSNGEQTKLLLAVLFLKENNFLLIDEPTNHLDIRGREIVSQYLNRKKGFILVSHDRAFLDGCVDHVLSINKADITVQKGNFSQWLHNKELQDNFELAENEKLKKEIGRLQETAREKASWSDKLESSKIGGHIFDRGYVGHKAEKMMARSKAIEKRQQAAMEEKSKLLKNIEQSVDLKIFQAPYPKQQLIEVLDLSIAYSDTPIFECITFSVERGDRIVLQGPNGCGKSSILKLLMGQPIPYTGTVRIGSNLEVSYVPQDASGLSGTLEDYARTHGIEESLFKAVLSQLDVTQEQFSKDTSSFSAGQKKKVLLAASLCQPRHLHIWDEPMNYIDVISRIQIEKLLLKYKPTILFVEHDKMFCEHIATKTVEL